MQTSARKDHQPRLRLRSHPLGASPEQIADLERHILGIAHVADRRRVIRARLLSDCGTTL